MTLKEKVIKAAKYIKNGHPLKDVMDQRDIEDAVLLLAKLIKNPNPRTQERG